MAQVVGYFEDNVEYTEGPFVIVHTGGWRIESELKGHKCPVLPHASIYRYRKKRYGSVGKYKNSEDAVAICDELNILVKDEKIIRNNYGQWIHPEYCERESS